VSGQHVSNALYRLPAEQRSAVLALAVASLKLRAELPPTWHPYPHQVPPDGDWTHWLMLAGRGAGKTDAGSAFVDTHATGPACLSGPTPHRIAIIAPTNPDGYATCVRGESGLLSHNGAIMFVAHSQKRADLTWPNGSEAMIFGAYSPEDVQRLRGPQHCLLWAEEWAAWRYMSETWDMARLGLRLGVHPRAIFTTTPRPRQALREMIASPDTVVTRATTDDNPSLAASVRADLYRVYGGTRLGRQELGGELIDDVPGALWTRAILAHGPAPRIIRDGIVCVDLARIVVAVDPAITSGEDSDETGIIVAGLGHDRRGYVLADLTTRMSPIEWARRAIGAYHEHRADRIIAEANQGGDMVSTVIRTVDPLVPVTLVHASRGKRTRAEPVAALYEQGKVTHCAPFPELEDQLCSFTGDPGESSPDRLDALVWALSGLMLGESTAGADFSMVA
jgi:predicted phage terminase large subunit-like protein